METDSHGRVRERFDRRPIYCTQFHPELNRSSLLERLQAYPKYVRTITGVTRGAERGHIARATLDAMALQNADILLANTAQPALLLRNETRAAGHWLSSRVALQYPVASRMVAWLHKMGFTLF